MILNSLEAVKKQIRNTYFKLAELRKLKNAFKFKSVEKNKKK